jgi:hypothetical protein
MCNMCMKTPTIIILLYPGCSAPKKIPSPDSNFEMRVMIPLFIFLLTMSSNFLTRGLIVVST